ncbi:MAG: glycosyltransferase family 4 protein [Syntrophorhabdaceae bacterium]
MKVLHLFSDWKWTGPADPVLSLCENLSRQSVDVTLACRKTPIEFPERTVDKEARQRGIRCYEGLRLNRYFSVRDWWHDLTSFNSYVEKANIDIVHTHLSHDYFTAIAALSFFRKRPLIIRTDHKRDGLPVNLFMSWAMARTEGLITYSKRLGELDKVHFNFPPERMRIVPPAVKPFTGPVKNLKGEFGIAGDECAIGVIGRLKPDRGYDIILKAFSILKKRVDKVKLIIVGRSSQIETAVIGPIRELGIEKDVIIAGYRIEDYFSVIHTFDLYIMMRAGSDGSGRALREVLSQGKPAIVSDKGMLPDLVENEATGFVTTWDAEDLAGKMERLVVDRELRSRLGENARKRADTEWDFTLQARAVKGFYEALLAMGRRT